MSNKSKNNTGKMLLWVLSGLMFLVMLAACGFSAWMFMQMKTSQPDTARVDHKTPALTVANTEPLYQSLSTFTISLKPTDKESDRVLFIGLSLRMADKQSLQVVEKFLPEYRSRLLLLLAKFSYEDLATDEGKQRMIEKIKQEIQQPLASELSVSVADVLVNEFVLR